MVGIEFRFVSGSYHATPWGRHVNEADVEWPPSPWRILRALIATYHQYQLHRRYDQTELQCLVEALCGHKPYYRLPRGVHTHTKHYMPLARGERTLVHDAFLRVPPDEPLGVYWTDVNLTSGTEVLLADIVRLMPYLGRAESWVEAAVVKEPPVEPDACPIESDTAKALLRDAEGEPIDLLYPVAPEVFARDLSKWTRRPANGTSQEGIQSILDALTLGTDVLEKEKRNLPIGATYATYVRRSLDVKRSLPAARPTTVRPSHNVARFKLTSAVPTRLVHTLDISEVVHHALIGILGKEDLPPSSVTGRDPESQKPLRGGHRHMFILPVDEDLDGYLDHVIVYQEDPFDPRVAQVLESLRHLYTPQWWPGRPLRWHLYLEGFWTSPRHSDRLAGTRTYEIDDRYLRMSRVFTSVTPYLHPWHHKRHGTKFSPKEQLLKELCLRELPEPAQIQPLGQIHVGGLPLLPHRFRRLRYGKHQQVPDEAGTFWRIEFAKPVPGPIALGTNCHFGMGLFVADEVDSKSVEG